jgi:hypothetical protein
MVQHADIDHTGIPGVGGSGVLNKFDATTSPAVGDDGLDGYAVGSVWIDVTNDRSWVAVDVSTGAAIWLELASKYVAYTPTLTGSSSNPTLGSGSNAQGRYIQNGKRVAGYGSIGFGTSGTAAGSGNYLVSLPVTMRTPVNADGNVVGWGQIFDNDAGAMRIVICAYNTTTTMLMRIADGSTVVTHASPWAWAASDIIMFRFDYEAA